MPRPFGQRDIVSLARSGRGQGGAGLGQRGGGGLVGQRTEVEVEPAIAAGLAVVVASHLVPSHRLKAARSAVYNPIGDDQTFV